MIEVLTQIQRVLKSGGLFFLTLMSTRNSWYGKGTEVEPNTFDNPEKEDGEHLHHFSDKKDVISLLSGWELKRMEDVEQTFSGKRQPDSWHWNILARNK